MRDEGNIGEDAARQLYAFWREHPAGVDVGAISHLGHYLVMDVGPLRWHSETEYLLHRARAVLAICEPDEVPEARERRASHIAIQAQFLAVDELELKAAKEKASAKVIDLAQAREKREANCEAPVVEKLSEVLLRVSDQISAPLPAISTPFPHLNWLLLGGFRAGELVYLGARPGRGKSALALDILRHAAYHGHTTLMVTREMSNDALGRRLIAQDGRLDAGSLRTGKGVDVRGVHDTIERLYDLPVHMTQKARTIAEIHAVAQAVPELALIIVDYLQLLTAPREIRDRRLQVEYLSVKLKAMAVHMAVPILVLSSLSRPETKSAQKPPTLASLRESGSLEHDADTVILLHRVDGSTRTQCIVAKNRDAMLGTVDLVFHAESVAFDELMSADEEQRYGN